MIILKIQDNDSTTSAVSLEISGEGEQVVGELVEAAALCMNQACEMTGATKMTALTVLMKAMESNKSHLDKANQGSDYVH